MLVPISIENICFNAITRYFDKLPPTKGYDGYKISVAIDKQARFKFTFLIYKLAEWKPECPCVFDFSRDSIDIYLGSRGSRFKNVSTDL